MDAHRQKLQSREEDKKKMTQLRKTRYKLRGTGATLEEKELDQVTLLKLNYIIKHVHVQFLIRLHCLDHRNPPEVTG